MPKLTTLLKYEKNNHSFIDEIWSFLFLIFLIIPDNMKNDFNDQL